VGAKMKFIIFLLLFLPMLAQAADLDNCEDVDANTGFPSGACELPDASAQDDNATRMDILAQPQTTGTEKIGVQNAI
jgi:hypothetical protein